MNKKDLIQHVSTEHKLPVRQAKHIVDGIFHEITGVLAKGDAVQILGFGTWSVRQRAKRKGRNPYTNESINIPAKKVPAFKPGVPLKEAVLKGKLQAASKPAKKAAKPTPKAAKAPAKKAAPAKKGGKR